MDLDNHVLELVVIHHIIVISLSCPSWRAYSLRVHAVLSWAV